jgi:hypothetical protein
MLTWSGMKSACAFYIIRELGRKFGLSQQRFQRHASPLFSCLLGQHPSFESVIGAPNWEVRGALVVFAARRAICLGGSVDLVTALPPSHDWLPKPSP